VFVNTANQIHGICTTRGNEKRVTPTNFKRLAIFYTDMLVNVISIWVPLEDVRLKLTL